MISVCLCYHRTLPPMDIGELSDIYNTELSNILDRLSPLKTWDIVDRTNSEWYSGKLGEMTRGPRNLERRYAHTKLAVDRYIYNIKCLVYDHLMNTTKVSYNTNKVYYCLKDQG